MANFEIKHEIGILASTEKVYTALTNIKQLAQWWTTDVRGTSDKVGETLEFWFGDFGQKMKVKALTPNQLVCWKATDQGVPEWTDTEIEFALEMDGDQCVVNFKHSLWKTNTGMLPSCSTKWAVFLLSLKDLVEKGKGAPFPNDLEINHY